VRSANFWNYWTIVLWRRQLYSDHKLNVTSSNAGDFRSGCWSHQWWAVVSARQCHSSHSPWTSVLFETLVSQKHYFMLFVTLSVQPGTLTSLCPTTFWGHWKAKCMKPNLMLRELNEHIKAKITAIDKCLCEQLWLIVWSWTQEYIACQGEYLENIIFKI